MNHDHSKAISKAERINNTFLLGIALNLLYVLVQIVIGISINSLSLLSDAGHNFLDVSSMALSLLALRLTKSTANSKFTYGWKKSSILIALVNAIVLLISIGAIGFAALSRLRNPAQLPGIVIASIALIGVFINGISAFLFFRQKEEDINIRSAFLHLLSDTLVSLGLVAGGILIYYTHSYWIDPLLSILICLVILYSTWDLLKDSLFLSMDAVPPSIMLAEIVKEVQSINGVVNLHHVHIWAISTRENALTGHLVVEEGCSIDQMGTIRQQVRELLDRHAISHVTLEIELANNLCHDEFC